MSDILVPRLSFAEEQWRLIGPTGKTVVCIVNEHPAGFEVHVGDLVPPDDSLATKQIVRRDLEYARDYAAVIRDLFTERLGFKAID